MGSRKKPRWSKERRRVYKNYWKRKNYQQKELDKQRKRVKILLALIIGLILLFASLFLIGQTGQQMVKQTTDAVDSFTTQIFQIINQSSGIIIVILIILFVILPIVGTILSWIPKHEIRSGAY